MHLSHHMDVSSSSGYSWAERIWLPPKKLIDSSESSAQLNWIWRCSNSEEYITVWGAFSPLYRMGVKFDQVVSCGQSFLFKIMMMSSCGPPHRQILISDLHSTLVTLLKWFGGAVCENANYILCSPNEPMWEYSIGDYPEDSPWASGSIYDLFWHVTGELKKNPKM